LIPFRSASFDNFLSAAFPSLRFVVRSRTRSLKRRGSFVERGLPATAGLSHVKLTPEHVRGTLRRASRLPRDTRFQEDDMGRALLLWLIGIPIPIILIIWLLGGLHG